MSAGADVVALQEVTRRTLPEWEAALAEAGYAHRASAVGRWPRPSASARSACCTAAREPLERLPAPDVPWPERVLCCEVAGVEVINLHSPIAPAPDLAKVRTHEAVAAYLAAEPALAAGAVRRPQHAPPRARRTAAC